MIACMRTAILAGGIAVVRSGVGYVEDGDEVLDPLATGLQPRRVEQKPKKLRSIDDGCTHRAECLHFLLMWEVVSGASLYLQGKL